MLIRECTDADWLSIWPFFDEIVADGETYALPQGLTSQRARDLWVQGPPWGTFVAVDGEGADAEQVLGTAKCGPNRPGGGSHVATASFMVSPAARGRGVGRALGEHVLGWARERGFLAMQFNAVVETNTAAVALWRSLGFGIVGTVPQAFDHPEHGHVGLHVMHRFL
ncbi:GNAT family N-acetyltransferase [Kineococcus rhizosphaerae]|uniref:Ribosomal protein S18 acetylase RimI-like enzyme n=1 Tax=Kineococcus rhizosphaerae TaxID=559628 RepID=A0A2T0R7M6_9ACTN|nr:GNAT family N-acetyltransferase [Kineococcus rhizosphaerae]PRY17163.1 ribosomal protein S18 acetylase RimI-like enzyme [Kineococcus rhizosphaerae]